MHVRVGMFICACMFMYEFVCANTVRMCALLFLSASCVRYKHTEVVILSLVHM